MAKTVEEIKELLATELFQKGIAKKHIIVNNDYTTVENPVQIDPVNQTNLTPCAKI